MTNTKRAKPSAEVGHTPGPFLSMGAKYEGRAYRVQKGGEKPCECHLWDDDTGPNGKGNGIQFFMCPVHAVAPDLLEAAKEAEAVFLTLAARFNGLKDGEIGREQALSEASKLRAVTDATKAEGREAA